MSRHLTDKEEAEDRSEKLFFNWAEERPAKFGIVFENELNRDLLSSRQIISNKAGRRLRSVQCNGFAFAIEDSNQK